jgi:hypothetical protein
MERVRAPLERSYEALRTKLLPAYAANANLQGLTQVPDPARMRVWCDVSQNTLALLTYNGYVVRWVGLRRM